LLRRFASGAAVAEQVPSRALRADFGTPATFIFAIVPLDEVRLDLGDRANPANSQVWRARCNGLVNTLAKVSP